MTHEGQAMNKHDDQITT